MAEKYKHLWDIPEILYLKDIIGRFPSSGSVVKLIGISRRSFEQTRRCVNMVWQVIAWGRPSVKSRTVES